MRNIGFWALIQIALIMAFFSQDVSGVEMEFNVGLAYDHPVDKPLPEITNGYGYNFGTCIWFKQRYGVAAGVLSTRHELSGESPNANRIIQSKSERNVIYLEGRYKVLATPRWELFVQAGGSIRDKINGGDSSGSYLQYSDSSSYDNSNIGYSGSGFCLGLSVYRSITSFNRGYFVFAAFRYNFVKYSRVQFYGIARDFMGTERLTVFEADASRGGDSFSVLLGVILRFNFSQF